MPLAPWDQLNVIEVDEKLSEKDYELLEKISKKRIIQYQETEEFKHLLKASAIIKLDDDDDFVKTKPYGDHLLKKYLATKEIDDKDTFRFWVPVIISSFLSVAAIIISIVALVLTVTQ